MQTNPFIDFKGNKVVVTGATSGIGEAIAVELDSRNASVILVGRDREKLQAVSKSLKRNHTYTLQLDLSDIVTTNLEICAFAKRNGPVYGLCHAAGIVETRPLASLKTETLNAMMNVNCIAGIELAKSICRRKVMVSDGGSIVYISSIYAHVGMPGQIGYSATKGAIISAARAMALELSRRNIRVNTVSPGMVTTPMVEEAMRKIPQEKVNQLKAAHPLGVGYPKDIAHAVAFLLAPQTRWITGADLVIDGGYTAQ